MKRRAGKIPLFELMEMRDERQFHRKCPYCGRGFHVFLVGDVFSSDVCVSCCMTLDRCGVWPAVPSRSCGLKVSQAVESKG